MVIKTSVGNFLRDEFIKNCNENSFPIGLQVYGCLFLGGCTSLTVLPEELHISEWLDLYVCTSLTTLPKGLKVGGTIYTDPSFIEQYPFKDLPKILHLPFLESRKQILIERLKNGY
jgi:hypothetical protein